MEGWVRRYAYFLMMRFQQAVDVPTWWGAYERAITEGNDEEQAISLADQGVIDSQGGGHLKRTSRGGARQRRRKALHGLLLVHEHRAEPGRAAGHDGEERRQTGGQLRAALPDPAAAGMALKAAITPGDSGDDDPEKIARKLLATEIDYLMGCSSACANCRTQRIPSPAPTTWGGITRAGRPATLRGHRKVRRAGASRAIWMTHSARRSSI